MDAGASRIDSGDRYIYYDENRICYLKFILFTCLNTF